MGLLQHGCGGRSVSRLGDCGAAGFVVAVPWWTTRLRILIEFYGGRKQSRSVGRPRGVFKKLSSSRPFSTW